MSDSIAPGGINLAALLFVLLETVAMDQAWLQQRPHLASLVRTLDELLKLADEQYNQGRASGEAVDYGEFEERAARAAAEVEQWEAEATCKSLVSVRMKRCGARWKHQSGNEILQLRALQLSDRWDAAMPRILGPLRKAVHVVSAAKRFAAPPKQPAFSRIITRLVVRSWATEKTCDLAILQAITNI